MQKTTALLTAEAEYYSALTAATEIIYLHQLLTDLGFPQHKYTQIYEDNTACIEWGNIIIGCQERAKHINIKKHFAHEAIQNSHMHLIQVPTTDQLADILTKGLIHCQLQACMSGILETNLKGPWSSRGEDCRKGHSSRVTSALKRGV